MAIFVLSCGYLTEYIIKFYNDMCGIEKEVSTFIVRFIFLISAFIVGIHQNQNLQ